MKNLAKHDKIAVDVDDTLLGNSPGKHILWDFISANKNNKIFYLVTFRIKPCIDEVFDDLFSETSVVAKDHFAGLVGIPPKVFFGEDLQTPLVEWKGLTAFKLGCTLLIDDLPDLVLPGCRKYGVDYLHPRDLTYG